MKAFIQVMTLLNNASHTASKTTYPVLKTAAALLLLLTSIYLITYMAAPHITDEMQYFDGSGSVVRFGYPWTDRTLWINPPKRVTAGQMPLIPTIADPLMIYTAAPVYALADRLDGVGLMHFTWLYNVVMSAVCAVQCYLIALRLGIQHRASMLTALSFGLLTISWHFSQTFFREPLMMACLLTGVLFFLSIPKARTRIKAGLWLIGGIISFVLAYFTKDIMLFMLPGILILLIPSSFWARKVFRRLALFALGFVLLIIFAFIYTPVLVWVKTLLPGGNLFSATFPLLPDTTRVALHSYLLSIGGSVWGTSPILLLAIPGAWMLWRRQPAYTLSALFSLFGLAIGYALFRGEGPFGGNWYGGGNVWPIRFMLPAMPMLVVLTGAVWEMRKPFLVKFIIALICVYSLWWQLSSVVLDEEDYRMFLFPLAFGRSEWLPGLNDIAYLRPVILTQLIGKVASRIVWARTDILPFALLFLLPLTMSLIALRIKQRARLWILGGAVVSIGITYIGLRLIYTRDPVYDASRNDLHEIAQVIRDTVPENSVVILNDPDTTLFWLNYGKFGSRWLFGLSYHKADRVNPDDASQRHETDAATELTDRGESILTILADLYPRLWVFMDDSIHDPYAGRPLERYMSERYYYVTEAFASSRARLLSYDTSNAPAWDSPAIPETPETIIFTDAQTGDKLTLAGYTLPKGTSLENGEAFPISLVWQTDSPLTRDYTVAMFLENKENPFIQVQGIDTWPAASFRPTHLMRVDIPIWDNRALPVSSDWPTGDYQLRLKVYFNDGSQIVDLQPETNTGDAILNLALTLK